MNDSAARMNDSASFLNDSAARMKGSAAWMNDGAARTNDGVALQLGLALRPAVNDRATLTTPAEAGSLCATTKPASASAAP
jgi:hypothetical protein